MVRQCSRAVLGLTAIVICLLAAPLSASAATSMLIKGTVACSGGQRAVGVWIESSAGGSEWADDQSWQYSSTSPNRSYRYFEETVTSPSSRSSISLHVGCGGEPSRWTKDLWSAGIVVGSKGRDINVVCDYNKPQRKAGACTTPPVGTAATTKPYPRASGEGRYPGDTSGYCTGGAVYQWYKATGYWPYVNRGAPGLNVGHAKYMDDHARANRFRLSTVPQVRSLVVFNAQGSFGHVGWVTKVYRKSGKVVFEYVDRNGDPDPDGNGITAAFGKDKARPAKAWDSTQTFILAPA